MGIASDFVLIVLAGLAGAILARLLRLPLLVGYVAAGIAVGPHTNGPTVSQLHDIELLAEIGVALLLFSLGLEVSLRDLQPVKRVALIGGPIQIVLTCAVAALGCTTMLGMSATEGIWFGAMIAVSSTMVVLKTLASQGVTTTLASRVMVGLLVVQDLAVIPMLVILPQLESLTTALPKVIKAILIAAALLGGVVVLGSYLLPRLLRSVLRWGTHELFLVSVVATGIGVGFATHIAGLSFALGAFVAGMILSESEFSHQAFSDVVPLRDIFGLLFFVTVGMLFDPRYAWEHKSLVLVTMVLIFLGKAIILGGIARGFGYGNMAPWIIGLGLAQVGEFSFVLARTGLNTNQISKSTYDLALSCTVLSMALSPVVSAISIPLGRRWPARLRKGSAPTAEAEQAREQVELKDHVIVGGYGRTGKAVAQVLQDAGIPFVVVEFNYSLLTDVRGCGYEAIWGDLTRAEILHSAQVERARLLLLSMPDQTSVHLTVERARQLNPKIIVVARAVRRRQLEELRRLQVESAIQPEFEGGVEMVRQALIRYGYDDSEMSSLIQHARHELYEATLPDRAE